MRSYLWLIFLSLLYPSNSFIKYSAKLLQKSLFDSLNSNSDNKLPELYVILSNQQSGNNIGSICRNALAFNACEVIVVGRNSYIEKMRGSDRGAKSRLKFVNFPTLMEARNYLIKEKSCSHILGVEIHENAKRIHEFPFTSSTAFLFGNEGGGLSAKQRDICDGYVYISQYASGGMASINVACASAIIFDTYAKWANYPESTRIGEKFV